MKSGSAIFQQKVQANIPIGSGADRRCRRGAQLEEIRETTRGELVSEQYRVLREEVFPAAGGSRNRASHRRATDGCGAHCASAGCSCGRFSRSPDPAFDRPGTPVPAFAQQIAESGRHAEAAQRRRPALYCRRAGARGAPAIPPPARAPREHGSGVIKKPEPTADGTQNTLCERGRRVQRWLPTPAF